MTGSLDYKEVGRDTQLNQKSPNSFLAKPLGQVVNK